MKKIRFSFMTITILILVSFNLYYYLATKETLKHLQKEKIELVMNHIQNSIECASSSEQFFNLFLSQELRQSSIAILHALPPKISQVKNEDLVMLSEKLGLQGISLMTKTNKDIVISKSSSQKEIGTSTNTWGRWYTMYNELFTNYKVNPIPNFGESAPNFWSSPIVSGVTNSTIITKFGYYYDGTTDYMINPFIDKNTIVNFYKYGGVNDDLKREMEMNPMILDISVLNYHLLTKGTKTDDNAEYKRKSEHLINYGKYKYRSEKDAKYAENATDKGKMVDFLTTENNKRILKHYVLINIKNGDSSVEKQVVIISSDYDQLQASLNNKYKHIFIISVLSLIVWFILIYTLIMLINRRTKIVFNVQEMYTKHIQSLYNSVKEHRHDFNHHLYTISGLANMNLYDELKTYIEKLLKIQLNINDIINVNIPAFSGLLQAKIVEAGKKKITFEHHFENFDYVDLDIMKVTELVRIIGNILDNAFHAVMENEDGNRKVFVNGRYHSGWIIISVYNNGEQIPEEHLSKIFTHGFTTRKDRGGNGLGLASSKKIIEKYKGSIKVSSDSDWTNFVISLPVSQREILYPNENKKGYFLTKSNTKKDVK